MAAIKFDSSMGIEVEYLRECARLSERRGVAHLGHHYKQGRANVSMALKGFRGWQHRLYRHEECKHCTEFVSNWFVRVRFYLMVSMA